VVLPREGLELVASLPEGSVLVALPLEGSVLVVLPLEGSVLVLLPLERNLRGWRYFLDLRCTLRGEGFRRRRGLCCEGRGLGSWC